MIAGSETSVGDELRTRREHGSSAFGIEWFIKFHCYLECIILRFLSDAGE
jgi:hypothetical protein